MSSFEFFSDSADGSRTARSTGTHPAAFGRDAAIWEKDSRCSTCCRGCRVRGHCRLLRVRALALYAAISWCEPSVYPGRVPFHFRTPAPTWGWRTKKTNRKLYFAKRHGETVFAAVRGLPQNTSRRRARFRSPHSPVRDYRPVRRSSNCLAGGRSPYLALTWVHKT